MKFNLERLERASWELQQLASELSDLGYFEESNLVEEAISKIESDLELFSEDEEWDGQPDEAQEWYDFDPDC